MTQGFFAVEKATWTQVSQIGLNAMTTYLVLACGTASDNRTSTWSVKAVEKYTGISRDRAKVALNALKDAGLIASLRGGARPRYDVLPMFDPDMTSELGTRTLRKLRDEDVELTAEEAEMAAALTAQGLLTASPSGAAIVKAGAEPDWIWLPNTIVTGADAETPPVERVRQTRDPMALRLFVDLYHAQNLTEHGGISADVVVRGYDRETIGQQGPYNVYGFSPRSPEINPHDVTDPHIALHDDPDLGIPIPDTGPLFDRLNILHDLGLLERVTLLMDGDGPEAEILHPLARTRAGNTEDTIARAAATAAGALLTDPQELRALGLYTRLVPAYRHIQNLQMIDILRLRHRPHTRRTSQWWATMQDRARMALDAYQRMRGQPQNA
jgi:hypothetical protein